MATCRPFIFFIPQVLMVRVRLTFAGSVRTRIGWRFAIYEMQALLIEIVSTRH